MDAGTVSYEYDNLGQLIRVNEQRGDEPKTYIYTYDSGFNMTSEKVYAYTTEVEPSGEPEIQRAFTYDSIGNPVAVMYNNVEYYYVKNLQGDIIGLVDASGAWVVEYSYDAWGNILSVEGTLKDTLGQDNPLRYRGYFYDAETGLYYLGSRYYSPKIGRFISADRYISTGTGFAGFNMFAYCNNNPILMVDIDGKRPVVGTSTNSETTYERKLSFQSMNKGNSNNSGSILEKACLDYSKELKAYSKEHGLIKAVLYFVDCVKTGGKWDFKHSWGLDSKQQYGFKGNHLRHDDLGNIHFGYVGSELFSVEILWYGAGAYQAWSDFKGNNEYNISNIKWHYFYTAFDDPRDQQMVVYGNVLWKIDHFFE